MTDTWIPEFQCCAISVIYNWRTRAAILVLPELNCTDMAGAIAFCERIDPRVVNIITVVGDELDTRYALSGVRWVSYRASPGTKATGLPRFATE